MKRQGEWRKCKLEELGSLSRGRSRHRPRNEPTLYGGEYPFFQTGDIKEANLYLTKYEQTYNEKGLAQSRLWNPGTLCITIAANIAETAILGIPGCFPDSVVGFTADPNKSDTRFVKYYIDLIKLDMQSISRGTTQDNLSLEKLQSFDFFIPEINLQRKIASILSAYDDLIENNARRIAILEESAQRLYREWFVHFRFPGHEKVKMVESEIGVIPKGWGVLPFSDAVKINPSYAKPVATTFSYVEMAGLSNSDMLILVKEKRNEFKGTKFKNGDTLVARITPCLENGKTGFVQCLEQDEVGTGSTEFIVLQSVKLVPEMIYLIARQDDFRQILIKSMSGASGRQRATASVLHDYFVAIPSPDVLKEFQKIVRPAFQQIELLNKANANLRRTRDLLLPQLISGRLDVSELEIKVA